jgi:hypothetical protein
MRIDHIIAEHLDTQNKLLLSFAGLEIELFFNRMHGE